MNDKTSTSIGLSNGLFVSLILLVYTLTLYLIDPAQVLGWLALLSYVILIGFMVKSGRDERERLGGYMTFKEAIKPIFLCSVVAVVVMNLFTYILFVIIDPGMADLTKDVTIDRVISLMEWMGAPESTIDQTIDEMEKQDYTQTVGRTFMNTAVGMIIGFGFAVIISLILKKKNPEEAVYAE